MEARRLVPVLALAIVSVLAAGDPTARAAPRPAGVAEDLIVHEWGTFTTRAAADGTTVTWNPLAVPTDLPTFVYQNKRTPKRSIQGTVRMETPVLYFYSGRRQTVSVDVGFPNGTITEWYPRVRHAAHGVRWPAVTLLPGASPRLKRQRDDSHYYPARETDAVILRTRLAGVTQFEKFLFYRGVGTFALPVTAGRTGDDVVVRNGGADPIGRVLVFENRGGSIGHRGGDLTADQVTIVRPVPAAGALDAFRAELRTLLVAGGLYEREADAMLETWKSTWAEEGLRVFYVLPRSATDAVLPLTITPAPADVVRVLVGRVELLDPS